MTTVCIDSIEFLGPAYMNDTILLEGRVTWMGRTSMEVLVESYVETLEGERRLINRAYLVYVAMDGLERPTEVPRFEPRDRGRADRMAAGPGAPCAASG